MKNSSVCWGRISDDRPSKSFIFRNIYVEKKMKVERLISSHR